MIHFYCDTIVNFSSPITSDGDCYCGIDNITKNGQILQLIHGYSEFNSRITCMFISMCKLINLCCFFQLMMILLLKLIHYSHCDVF